MVAIVLSISVILQFVAAGMALGLIRITGRRSAWAAIATAIILMGVRRCITLFRLISGDLAHRPDVSAELVALGISLLMLVGVVLIGPIFRSMKRAEEELEKHRRSLEEEVAERTGEMKRISEDLFLEVRERERAEGEVKRYTSQLEAANKELEAFAYSVSHDLRAPLRSIDGFSQALVEDCGDELSDDGKDYVGRVRAGARRMGNLIDDLLELSRITRWELERGRIDLSSLARGTAEALEEAYPARKVDFVVEEGLTADGDLRLLKVVMQNLMGNAFKYTGKIEDARIEFGASRNGDCHRGDRDIPDDVPVYFVRDNGCGFDMSYADKLFGAFQRLHTEGEFEGTGIGLATVQRAILRHGGRVWAEAEVDKGATFYFTLL
jgi:signal transduction histidine kinase